MSGAQEMQMFVRLFVNEKCLELTIFIFMAYVSCRSVSGLSWGLFKMEAKILGLVKLKVKPVPKIEVS